MTPAMLMHVQTRPNAMFSVAFGKVCLLVLKRLVLDMFWPAVLKRIACVTGIIVFTLFFM